MAPCLPEELNMSIMQYMRYQDAKSFLQAIKQQYIPDLLDWIKHESLKSLERQTEILTEIATRETNIVIISYCTEFFSDSQGIILWCRALVEKIIAEWMFKHVISRNQELVDKFFVDVITNSSLEIFKFVYEIVPQDVRNTTIKTASSHKRRDIIEWLCELSR